jgi:transposase
MGRKSQYTEAYKREAVAKAKTSGNVSQTARELGVSNKSLHEWIKQFSESKRLNSDEVDAQELVARVRELEKQLSVRDQQIEVLKKAIGIVSQDAGNGSS